MLNQVSRYGIRLELWKHRQASTLRQFYIYLVGWGFMGGWIRLREIHRILKSVAAQPSHILDAGCGEGANTIFLSECFPEAAITATDWEATERFQGQIQSLKQMMHDLDMGHVMIKKQNLFDLNGQEKFDFILNIDVLEHIPDNQKIMSNFLDSLNPGGMLLLHMPREGAPAKSSLFPTEVFDDLAIEHIGRMYDSVELKQVLHSLGFADVNVVETFHWLAQTAWEWDRIIYCRVKVLYPIVFPFLKLMAWLDAYISFGRSFGLLAIAKRP